jgi:transglutaminase-like putative cysteine protease
LDFQVQVQPTTKVYEYETIGGFVNHFAVIDPHEELDIVAQSVVETVHRDLFTTLDLVSEDLVAHSSAVYLQAYGEFLSESPYVQLLPGVEAITSKVMGTSGVNTAKFILNLKDLIFEQFAYKTDVTNVHSLLNEVLDLSAGVCQDFSHLMIACCRQAGIPARYVSGYLYLGEGDHLRGTEATHAWIEVLMPDESWLAVDPTNNILADERYVKVHVGRDYSDVTPIKGIFVGFGTSRMDVTVAVQALSSA